MDLQQGNFKIDSPSVQLCISIDFSGCAVCVKKKKIILAHRAMIKFET